MPRRLASDSLTETAKVLLRMATMAHDLALKTITLEGLFKELRSMGECYAPFTNSKAQLVGLLLKYFDKCFTIRCDDNTQIHITSSEVCPRNVVECLEGVPRKISDLPWPDRTIRLGSHEEAVIVSYDGSSPETLSFNFHVGASSRAVYDHLNTLLYQYDHLLRDLEETYLAQVQTNQLCLYRLDETGQRLVRCRVMYANQGDQPILQNIDNGELIFGDACNIYQFPTQMSIDRFPPMAVQANFGRVIKFRDAARFEKMENVLTRLIQQRVVVKLLIVNADNITQQKQHDKNLCKTYKVRLIVDGVEEKESRSTYPDDLLLI
uniref:Tudor domain-containing protein n=1 Tax=Ditylenchus dipsaci TaxID=166011 RepID=A0A915ESD6_9BILA